MPIELTSLIAIQHHFHLGYKNGIIKDKMQVIFKKIDLLYWAMLTLDKWKMHKPGDPWMWI